MKKLIALITVLLIVGSVLAGCNENADESIFKFIYEEVRWNGTYSICYCKETKVMYSVSGNGAFTLLVNPDGTPMIYHGK